MKYFVILLILTGTMGSTLAQDPTLPTCTSTREACQDPPICNNAFWECNTPDIFNTTVGLSSKEKLNTTDVNYVDFRDATGEIIEIGCSIGLRATSAETDFGNQIMHFVKCGPFVLFLVLILIGAVAGAIFIIWKKRK